MSTTCFINGTIFTGHELVRDKSLLVEDGIIQNITAADKLPTDVQIYDLGGGILAPGFIDIQVNGGCGLLFNDSPSLETIEELIRCHRINGTTMLFPTLISTDYVKMVSAYETVELALNNNMAGLGGLHFEGPYLNKSKKGIHDGNKIKDISPNELDTFISGFSGGKLIMTLAPEKVSSQFLEKMTAAGILLLAGHSDVNLEQALQAFNSGITGVTHLYNAMSQFGSREPGLVGAALLSKDCWCTIIVDGYHVHPATLKVSIAAKGAEKFILVTDGMPSSGSKLTEYYLGKTKIDVINGRCSSSDGTLAGSNLTMIDAVKNCVNLLHQPLETALAMASLHPAQFLGIAHQYGKIEAGFFADLVQLDQNLNVLNTWIKGS